MRSLLLRWRTARHYGGAIEDELAAVALSGYRLAIGHPARLLGAPAPAPGRGVRTMYFDAPEPPFEAPMLLLNGEGQGSVNSVTVLSRIAPSYAPEGRSLISVSVVGCEEGATDSIESAALEQLKGWFGKQVEEWRALRHYCVPRSLPVIADPGAPAEPDLDAPIVCGDHLATASIQGAMHSGRVTAEALLRRLGMNAG